MKNVGVFVAPTVVAPVEQKEIHIGAGKARVNAGVVRLAVVRIGPMLFEGAQGNFLARHGAVAVVRAEVVIVPNCIGRNPRSQIAPTSLPALVGIEAALDLKVIGVCVMIVAQHQQQMEIRAARHVGVTSSRIVAVVAHA